MSAPPEVSIVLPAYNEASTIGSAVEATITALERFLPADSFEVLIAEDGCTDDTPEIAAKLARDHDRISHLHSDDRAGRGAALTRTFRTVESDVVGYIDTDLATDMDHLEELIESVRVGPYDLATGSRLLPDSRAARSLKRDSASRIYNSLVRTCFTTSVRDHQCGFKAFDRNALVELLPRVEDRHWFWDTELLIRAQRAGYRIHEFPVVWNPGRDTTVDVVRDGGLMGYRILRLWWQIGRTR
ncbi:dolichyl-phosphate beta-glucosyltransferase [Haladaptatus sp. DYF46]|uniref:dolichyl-phosphate beta-glucosyltransferase n=1 Tax=Haladaptatus sp. DYF46 TaxID=2886041 RepID=UPI003182BF94